LSEKLSSLDESLGDNALEAFISRLRKKLAGTGATSGRCAALAISSKPRPSRRAMTSARARKTSLRARNVVARSAPTRVHMAGRQRCRRGGRIRVHSPGVRPLAAGRCYAIAGNVTDRGGELSLNLSSRELRGILFDQTERVYYAVLRADGTLIAGDDGLRGDIPSAASPIELADVRRGGAALRMATGAARCVGALCRGGGAHHDPPGQLLERLLIDSMAPQALLLLLLGGWLWRSIGRELSGLAQAAGGAGAARLEDLAPVEIDAASADVERLAQAINALMARIDRGVQAQREFAGNVAHELRTPLAGIRALAEYGLAQKDPAVWKMQLRSIEGEPGAGQPPGGPAAGSGARR
jgi:signal transduction histidine kinase